MSRKTRPLRDRVLSRLIINPGTGCLLWTGGRIPGGYGQVRGHGGQRVLMVHRVMYEWFTGPIPDGLEIDHLCRVRHCASPAHMEAVPHKVNVQRGLVGTHWAAKRAAKQALTA